jgi:predicted RNase H-like nuclease (RuvC/YqgF family)
MSNKSEFETWMQKWDAAAADFAKESADALAASKKREREQPQPSYFVNSPLDYQNQELEAEPSWIDIFNRSQTFGDGDLINDAVQYSRGQEKPKQNFGAYTPTHTNPTQQSTLGPDQEDERTGLTRVSQNWGGGGEDLDELDRIKRAVEQLERKHHQAEVRGEQSRAFREELRGLRDRVKSLSQKINLGTDTDPT